MKKRMKYAAVLLLAVLLTATAALPAAAAFPDLQKTCDSAASPVGAAIVYNLTDDVILYEKNGTKSIRVASITKVLNACTAAQFLKANDAITVGSELSLMYWNSSTAPVYYGERYTFEQLLHAMLLPSGCAAAYVLAAAAGRKAKGDSSLSARAAIDAFIAEMNKFLKSLGCNNSHFVNPDGQDASNQYTTCEDYLKVLKYAVEHPLISSVIRKAAYDCYDLNGKYHYWYTTNVMHDVYPGTIGIKTGTTDLAGYCVAAAARRNGKTMISLVVNAPSHSSRYTVSINLLNAAFAYRVKGDADYDFRVTPEDARLTLRATVGLEDFDDAALHCADMDGDGVITPEDARRILRLSVGLK